MREDTWGICRRSVSFVRFPRPGSSVAFAAPGRGVLIWLSGLRSVLTVCLVLCPDRCAAGALSLASNAGGTHKRGATGGHACGFTGCEGGHARDITLYNLQFFARTISSGAAFWISSEVVVLSSCRAAFSMVALLDGFGVAAVLLQIESPIFRTIPYRKPPGHQPLINIWVAGVGMVGTFFCSITPIK